MNIVRYIIIINITRFQERRLRRFVNHALQMTNIICQSYIFLLYLI